MSQPFSFPPPPPPPPKRDSVPSTSSTHHPQSNRAGYGARGTFRNNQSQRGGNHLGRGQGHGRGHSRGSARASYLGTSKARQGSNGQLDPNRGPPSQISTINSQFSVSVNSIKRDHASAFPNNTLHNHRPKAPPPVPSFGIDFETILPKKPVTVTSKSPINTRKNNILGLTPSGRESESDSGADEDDEARLASTVVGNSISFEHKGQTLSLSSPAEISAWIAERRTKFPTQAKAEAAKKEAEAKKQKWEEEKKARREAAKLFQEHQSKDRAEREKKRLRERLIQAQIQKGKAVLADTKANPAEQARAKAEKLRKRAARAAEELRKAEEALKEVENPSQIKTGGIEEVEQGTLLSALRSHTQIDRQTEAICTENATSQVLETHNSATELEVDVHSLSDLSSSSSVEDTSSSGDSASDTESDLDGPPEESSSRRDIPERVPPPKRTGLSNDTPICRNLQKFGRCKFGSKCRFSHEVSDMRKTKTKGDQEVPVRRRGLYQIMVEKEEQERREQALRAIMTLGQQGLLDEDKEQAAVSTDSSGPTSNAITSDVLVEIGESVTQHGR